MADVSVARCESYEPSLCRCALEQALRPFGGLDWVKPGMKIGVITSP